MTIKMNYDAFTNAPVAEVTEAGFALINTLQQYEPHIQAHAAAVVFLLVCRQFKAEPQDVFTIVKNLMASDAAGHTDTYRALLMYVENGLE